MTTNYSYEAVMAQLKEVRKVLDMLDTKLAESPEESRGRVEREVMELSCRLSFLGGVVEGIVSRWELMKF